MITIVTVHIRGVSNDDRFDQVWRQVDRVQLYRRDGIDGLFADLERSQANLAVVNLNLMAGIRARILQDCQNDSPS